MKRSGEWLILGLIVALAVVGVFVSFGSNPLATDDDGITKLAIGEALDPDQKVMLVGTPPLQDFLRPHMGERATVFYSWSIPCPCPAEIDPRLRVLRTQFGKAQGVSWVAVDGEPADTNEAVIEKMGRLRAFYKMVLDPEQALVRRLGLPQAVCVALVDGEGRLRFRGSPDGVYDDGDGVWLADALRAVLAGEEVAVPERPLEYGCLFGDPASCEEYEKTPEALAEEARRDRKRAARAARRKSRTRSAEPTETEGADPEGTDAEGDAEGATSAAPERRSGEE